MSTPLERQLPHYVALMGFSNFEQQALDAYLKLARSRSPAYAPTDRVEEAHFVIANGDRGGVIDLLVAAQRLGDAVLVGHHARPGAAAWLERPIDPLHLFRALDAAVRRRGLAAKAARVSPRNITHAELNDAVGAESANRVALFGPTTLPPYEPEPPPLQQRRAWPRVPTSPSKLPLRRMPLTRSGEARLRAIDPPSWPDVAVDEGLQRALIVDADDAAAAAMVVMLRSLDVVSLRAAHSRDAFALLDAQAVDLVVIDVDLGPPSDLDGLSLSQAIKRQQRAPSESCPAIFVTSARPSGLEQARAMLAGASHYVAKPADVAGLRHALERVGLVQPAAGAPGADHPHA